jgi:ABC-type uncharacterized transport system substrate-binding protein
MRRRDFIKAIPALPALCPLAARAQQPAMPVVGFVNTASPAGYTAMANAFHQGLKDTGYADGQNVTIEYRWAEGHNELLPAIVADLVRRQVAVIAATSAPAALAAKAATMTIPIVFETGADPVTLGLVASLSHPLLHEVIPAAKILGLLVNPNDGALAESYTREVQAAAGSLRLELPILNASTVSDFDGLFAKLFQLGAGGLVISGGAFLTNYSEQLAVLALRHAMPKIFQSREFALAGGLLSYGAAIPEAYRLVGSYVGRILKGEKPDNLPVQRATKVAMYINLKTANALGIAVPLPLLGRADEVIE